MKRLILLLAILPACSASGDGGPSDTGGDDGIIATPDDGVPSDGEHVGDTDPPTEDDPPTESDPPVSYPACAADPLPASCGQGAVSPLPDDGFGTPGAFTVVVEEIDNPRESSPRPVTIYRPAGASGVPVVFFSHAFGATNVTNYDVLLRVLASRGVAVVHSAYATLNTTNASRYEDLWAGFTAAAVAYGDTFDLTRVGFVGHSFGGGATPEMARRGFNDEGWGANGRMMFIMAPWYSWGTGYASIPTDTHTVLQVYADDPSNDHQIAVHDIWELLPAGIDRSWLLIRSDVCECGLNADHVVPMTAAQAGDSGERDNGLDTWGVARRVHALATYAFAGDVAARAVAFGGDTDMGHFVNCGGRAVRPLEADDAPIVTTCVAPLYTYAARCDNADPDYPCD